MSKKRKVQNSNTEVGGLKFVLKLRVCVWCLQLLLWLQGPVSITGVRQTHDTNSNLFTFPWTTWILIWKTRHCRATFGVLIWKCFTRPGQILFVSLLGSDGFFPFYRDWGKKTFSLLFSVICKRDPVWPVCSTVGLSSPDVTLFNTVSGFFPFFATSTFSSFLWMRCKYDDVTDATFSWSYGGAQLHRLLLVSSYGLLAPNAGSS